MDLPESSNRKRQRAVSDDEISEFTPLSKRINNLHINNSFLPFVKALDQTNDQHKPEVLAHALMSDRLEWDSRNMDSSVALPLPPDHWSYSPDLSPAENPHYYEANRHLFQLYLERARRSSSHF